jgi:hypothetical protein
MNHSTFKFIQLIRRDKVLAYRQYITVQDPQHLVLSNLPVKAGQRVEVRILVKDNASMSNPAEIYSDAQWNELDTDLRSELETRYILNNSILIEQIYDQSEWHTIPANQVGIDVQN